MSSSFIKSSLAVSPYVILGSVLLAVLLAHFPHIPLDRFSFGSPTSTWVETLLSDGVVGNFDEKYDGELGERFIDETDNSSSLLSHVPEDFFAHLYVASSQSYLNEVDSPLKAGSEGSLDAASPRFLADESVNVAAALSSLKRQGGQIFAVDEFAEEIDVTAFSGQKIREGEVDGKRLFRLDSASADGAGGSGDPQGSGGSDGSGSDGSSDGESGSGSDGSNGGESGSGGAGSGGGESGSGGVESGSGSQPFHGPSGQAASGSGSGAGSGSGSKKKDCCILL